MHIDVNAVLYFPRPSASTPTARGRSTSTTSRTTSGSRARPSTSSTRRRPTAPTPSGACRRWQSADSSSCPGAPCRSSGGGSGTATSTRWPEPESGAGTSPNTGNEPTARRAKSLGITTIGTPAWMGGGCSRRADSRFTTTAHRTCPVRSTTLGDRRTTKGQPAFHRLAFVN